MADSKTIEMIIRAKDLATKPISEIGSAVGKLSERVESLVPASERGEARLSQLTEVSRQIGEALRGLATNQALIEQFNKLNAEFDEANRKLLELRDRATAAKIALSQGGSDKAARDASLQAERDLKKQEGAVRSLTKQLETASAKAEKVGIDLKNVAAAEALIDSAVKQANASFTAVNAAIERYDDNLAQAAKRRQALADAETAAAARAAKAQEDANRRTLEGVAALDRAVTVKQAEDAALARQVANRRKSVDAFWEEVRAVEAKRNAITASVVAEREAAAAEAKSAAAKQAAAAAASKLATQEFVRQENLRRSAPDQDRATQAIKRNDAAVRQLSSAYTQLNTLGSRLNTLLGVDQTGERRSLSFFQRLRGQVLSLSASYVGLFGAINSVTGVLDVVQKRTAIRGTFDVAFGSEAAEQMKDVEKVADKLGFRMLDLAQSYGKFAIASKSAGTSTKDTATIFEAFASVSRAAGLDTERTKNVFVALEQIMSKGKFAMEELRGQLGDALPGALGTLADALKIPQDELIKLIENGKLSSKFLLNFAVEYRTKFAGAIAAASNSPAAAIGRFQSGMDKLKETIANGGFIESFTALLERLTTFFKSPDGEKFAKALAAAFKLAADVLIVVVDNAKLLAVSFALLKTTQLVRGLFEMRAELLAVGKAMVSLSKGAVVGLISGISALRSAFLGLIVSASSFGSVAAGVVAALGAITAGFASLVGGFFVGKWLSDSFAGVRKFGVALVGGFVAIFDQIRLAWAKVKFWNPDREKEIERIKQEAADTQDFFAEEFKRAEKAPGDSGNSVGGTVANKRNVRDVQARIDAGSAAAERARAQAQLSELATAESETKIKAATQLQDKLDSLRAESLKKDAQTREEYQEAVRLQFADLAREIDEFSSKTDAKRGARMKAQLEEIIKLRVNQAGAEFDVDSAKRAETEINDLIAERDALVANINRERKAGVTSEADAAAAVAKLTRDYNDQIEPKIRALLTLIASLPKSTQDSLRALVGDMQTTLKVGLEDRPDNSEFLQIKQKAETIKLADKAHNDALAVQKQLLKDHGITQREYNTAVDALREKYSFVLTDSNALLESIKTSTTLTDDQRKALEGVVQVLESISNKRTQITEKERRIAAIQAEIANGMANALVPGAEAMAQIKTLGDYWIVVRDNMRNFFADYLANKAREIIAEQTLNLIRAAGKAFGFSFHAGGVVGAGSGNLRTVNPAWFANAPRYHTGGVVGLQRNEVPAILERGEEVLKRNDPRHLLNGGGQQSGQQPMNVKIVNTIDSGSVMEQGAGSAAGQRAILNVIKANASAIRSVLR